MPLRSDDGSARGACLRGYAHHRAPPIREILNVDGINDFGDDMILEGDFADFYRGFAHAPHSNAAIGLSDEQELRARSDARARRGLRAFGHEGRPWVSDVAVEE